jgi:rSAM/selenodomain-associated transferase 2
MTSESVLLSIVIPTLNEVKTLRRCLQQLQSLRAHKVEIIIADGGSCDGTTADIATLAEQLVLSAQGRARQMNSGAAVAAGRWLLFLHADTALPNDVDNWLAQLSVRQPQWGFFRLTLQGSQRSFRLIEWFINKRSTLTGVATGDQCLLVRRTLFTAVGGYPDIELMEDVALSKTLRRHSAPLVWPNSVTTSSRRWEKKGILRTVLLMWSLRLGYFLGVSPSRLAAYYRD